MSVTMYRFFILLLSVIISVHAEGDKRQCFHALDSAAPCCQFNVTEENEDMMYECFRTSHGRDPHSCDFETCYGEKKGFVLSNGTLDKTLLKTSIEKDYENYTDILEIVEAQCLIDDLNTYGPPDMCYLKKLSTCLQMHVLLNCPDWEESEYCNNAQNKVNECGNFLS